MEAALKIKPRSFDSYAEEYSLLTTETEINAFWERMDKLVISFSKTEKKKFFQELLASIEKDMDSIRDLKSQILTALKK